MRWILPFLLLAAGVYGQDSRLIMLVNELEKADAEIARLRRELASLGWSPGCGVGLGEGAERLIALESLINADDPQLESADVDFYFEGMESLSAYKARTEEFTLAWETLVFKIGRASARRTAIKNHLAMLAAKRAPVPPG